MSTCASPVPAQGITQLEIDQQVYDLYDEYCHGGIDRREFLARAAALTVVGGLAMAQALLPRYAQAQTISFTDTRIKATYVTYPSPGGNSGTMRGYLVQPAGTGPFPAVLVIHENRGLNPYIEDVTRRLAQELSRDPAAGRGVLGQFNAAPALLTVHAAALVTQDRAHGQLLDHRRRA